MGVPQPLWPVPKAEDATDEEKEKGLKPMGTPIKTTAFWAEYEMRTAEIAVNDDKNQPKKDKDGNMMTEVVTNKIYTKLGSNYETP